MRQWFNASKPGSQSKQKGKSREGNVKREKTQKEGTAEQNRKQTKQKLHRHEEMQCVA